MTSTRSNTVMLIRTVLLMLIVSACATAQPITHHSFEFDAAADSPGIEILDYRYGSTSVPATRPGEAALRAGVIPQYAIVGGPMRRGDILQVKWRIRSTGEILENTVDLRDRLPGNLENHRVYFIVRGRQLFVYLISPERIQPGQPRGPVAKYDYLKTTSIYP